MQINATGILKCRVRVEKLKHDYIAPTHKTDMVILKENRQYILIKKQCSEAL